MSHPKTIEGQLNASGLSFGLLASRFNGFVVDPMMAGAQDTLIRHGARIEDLERVWVPGAFEIPLAARKMAASGRYHGIVVIGAIIRGATPHFDHLAAQVTKDLAQVAMEQEIPLGFGVLTTDTVEQAIERAGTKAGNKGVEAAIGALEMVHVLRQLEGESPVPEASR